MSIENKVPIKCNANIISDKGPFYHGTKVKLQIGDLIKIGFSSNYGKGKKLILFI